MSLSITIVGAGSYGSRIAEKYKKFPSVVLKAVVSPRPVNSEIFTIPRVNTAAAWLKRFKVPTSQDVFDICVHQKILLKVLKEYIDIGARNFILPKPIALQLEELIELQKLVKKYHLNIVVASQWHYSSLLDAARDFIKKNRKSISHTEIIFSRNFDDARKKIYTPQTAFLPHMVQIAQDLSFISGKSKPIIESNSATKIKIRYAGKAIVSLESDIASQTKEETLKIFLKDKNKPSYVVDFSRATETEDVLEKMIERHIRYFSGSVKRADDVLTFEKYLPVAKEIVSVAEQSRKVVAVIGGGLFGVMTALQVAKKGYSVVLFEKETDILLGASLVNHCRIHMGYHYPRDMETVTQSLEAKGPFEKFFGTSVVRKIHNYYLIAKEGSLVSHEDFLAFCKKMNLPHKKQWPSYVQFVKDKISLSVKVPERIFDVGRKRSMLMKKISQSRNITLIKEAEVVRLAPIAGGYALTYRKDGQDQIMQVGAIVNATYGAINHINNLLKLKLNTFQYELCEILVARTPWHNTAWMIMDGPFFSAMPFGFSKDHLLYDVELSVLERSIGTFPEFKFGAAYYDTEKRRAERFKKFQEKWKPWVPEISKVRHVSSMYAIRVVLKGQDKTDKRPTIVKKLAPRFWQIFSGKIGTSVIQSQKLAGLIDGVFKKERK